MFALRQLGGVEAPGGQTRKIENATHIPVIITETSRGAPTRYTDSTVISAPYTTDIEGDVPVIGPDDKSESREVPVDNRAGMYAHTTTGTSAGFMSTPTSPPTWPRPQTQSQLQMSSRGGASGSESIASRRISHNSTHSLTRIFSRNVEQIDLEDAGSGAP